MARPRAGVARLRPHDLQRHRRRHGGAGRRRRCRTAVPRSRRRDRRAEGRRARQGRGGCERRLLPVPGRAVGVGRRRRHGRRAAGRLGEGRRGDRRRGRGRTGDGHDRRTTLPTLMGAIVLDGEPVAARIRGEVAERIERLQREGVHGRPGHHSRRRRRTERALRRAEARGLRRHRHVLGGRAPAGERDPGGGARRHRPLQRRSQGQRVPRAAAAARRARRGAGASRGRPSQGRRRTAPGEPRTAGARHAGPAAVHSVGDRRAVARVRRPGRRAPRGHHRARRHDRAPPGQPSLA